MKIVKLNRNFNIHKHHGFEVGLKFGLWDRNAQQVERVVADRLGNQSWSWKYHPGEKIKENWASGFGKHVKGERPPYWIYLRNESMLSLVMLSLEHNNE